MRYRAGLGLHHTMANTTSIRECLSALDSLSLAGSQAADLRTEPRGEDQDRHEGDLTEDGQDQRVSQDKELITQAQLLVQTCAALTVRIQDIISPSLRLAKMKQFIAAVSCKA